MLRSKWAGAEIGSGSDFCGLNVECRVQNAEPEKLSGIFKHFDIHHSAVDILRSSQTSERYPAHGNSRFLPAQPMGMRF
jgi:hypothetical protein